MIKYMFMLVRYIVVSFGKIDTPKFYDTQFINHGYIKPATGLIFDENLGLLLYWTLSKVGLNVTTWVGQSLIYHT